MLRIREARIDDLESITGIYNDAITNTVTTFDTVPKSLEEQRTWFAQHGSKTPILVAEKDGRVVGWASLSQWSDRCGYCDTSEVSVYVKEGYRGEGIGRNLTAAILQAGKDVGLHTVIARITESSKASIRLFESLGFTHIGIMREVGRKFGKLLNVHMMQKIFTNSNNID